MSSLSLSELHAQIATPVIRTCRKYSSEMRLAHCMEMSSLRSGLATSAHLSSRRLMTTLLSGVVKRDSEGAPDVGGGNDASVVGLSLITNHAAGIASHPITHAETLEIGKQSYKKMSKLMLRFLATASKDD